MRTSPENRLIVALDVPTHDEALQLVERLDNVSFFKIGLELFLAGDLFGFLSRLQSVRGDQDVFIDLKIAGDISRTIQSFVNRAATLGIRFMTFVEAAEESITDHTLAAGHAARDPNQFPEFLSVPMLSSIDKPDDYIVDRGRAMLAKGFDGIVASGTAIGALREANLGTFPIISPGIRPEWYGGADDHKRWTTPAAAIKAGANYLVVGRPIRNASDPHGAAQRIIDEMDSVSPRTG